MSNTFCSYWRCELNKKRTERKAILISEFSLNNSMATYVSTSKKLSPGHNNIKKKTQIKQQEKQIKQQIKIYR